MSTLIDGKRFPGVLVGSQRQCRIWSHGVPCKRYTTVFEVAV